MAKTPVVLNVAIFYHSLSKVKITSITLDDPLADVEEYLQKNDPEFRASDCSYIASDKPLKIEVDKEIAKVLTAKYTQAVRIPAHPVKSK